MRRTTLALVSILVLVAAGCGGKKGSSSSSASTTGGASAEGGATADAAACTPAKMETHSAETLTIATDKPAYPPYFENDEPENGEGFEGAVGYAIGNQLGYTKEQIKRAGRPWVASCAPGPTNCDFDLTEISITPVREKAVDSPAPYY